MKKTNESYSVEFSQSDIGNNLDNTLIEGAEIRKNNLSKEFEFQNLILRPDSPQIHSENNIDQLHGIIREDNKNSENDSVLAENTADCISVPCCISKTKNFSRQNGGRNSVAVFNPQQFTAPGTGRLGEVDTSRKYVSITQADSQLVTSKKNSMQNKVKQNSSVMLGSLQVGHSHIFQAQKSTLKKVKTLQPMGKLQQIMIMKSMIQRIMRYVPSAKYLRLTPLHFEAINDKALVLNDQNSLSDIMASFPTLQPNQILFDLWKISQILLVGFHLFRVLLMIGFQDETLELQKTIRIVSLVFFIIDCFLGLNAGFYEGQTIITDRQRIFRDNALEIASSGVSIFAMVFSQNSYINLIFILRLRSLFTNINIIEQNFSLNQKYPILVTITKLLLLIFLIAHTFACGFVLITNFEKGTTIYWIKKQALIGEPWEKVYLTSLYFAFITMITVGYGDITPITDIERAYVIFFTLITCIVYAYVVNTIGSLFSEFALKSAEFKKQRFQIVSYLNDRRISKPIQISVIKYLEYTQQQEKVLKYSKAGEQFLASIPQSLRQEVCEDYYGRILDQVTIFKKYFSKSCISALSQIMREETFGPEERIFSQDEEDFKLFFVMQGKVEILVNLKDTQNSYRCLGYLKKGQSFGEKTLFSCSSWPVTGRCLENTSIIFMKKEEFLSVIKEFRNDYEIYCLLLDKTIQDMEILELKCSGCFQKDHEVSDCELLFCKPRKSLLISKYNYYLKQEKRDQSIVRKGLRSQDSWKNNIVIRRQLKKLRISILNREFNNIISKLSRKNESLFDIISEDRAESDERFFNAIPEFYYHENEIVIALEEQDLNIESRSGSDIELDQEFDELLQDHHNSAGNKQIKIKQTSAIKSQDLILLESVSKSQQYLAAQNEDGGFPGPQYPFEKKQSTCIESPDCSIQCSKNNNNNIGLGIPSTTNLGSAQNIQIITNNNNFANHINTTVPSISSSNPGNNLINLNSGNNNATNIQISDSNNTNNNNQENNNSALIPNIPNANSINNITLNSNFNNFQRQLSTGNYSGPLSCPSAQIHQLSSQFFHAGENYIAQTQLDFQATSNQQNISHGYPSLFGGISRPPNQNKRKGSLPPIQRQNSNDRTLGINPTQITKMLQQIQNNNNNPQATFNAIISSNSASEINIPQNPSENGFKQVQLFMCPSSEFQQSRQSNNGTPMNRDQLLGEIENEDSKSKQPGFNQKRPGRQKKKTLISNELHLNQRKSRNYDQDQSPMKRRSKKNVTIFKDSVHLSVMNPMEKSQNKFLHYGSSSLLNHQLTVPQKLNSENQISLASGNASGRNTFLQEELQVKDLFVLMNFDQMHEYSYYFPNFNYSALRFRNKADQQAYQHISKTQHQNYVLKKNYSSIRP